MVQNTETARMKVQKVDFIIKQLSAQTDIQPLTIICTQYVSVTVVCLCMLYGEKRQTQFLYCLAIAGFDIAYFLTHNKKRY